MKLPRALPTRFRRSLTSIADTTDTRGAHAFARAVPVSFFLLAGVLALVMRLQLSRPNDRLVGPDTYDALLLYPGPFDGNRFVDVSENALYWYFVVLSWLPIYAVIYIAPRIHP